MGQKAWESYTPARDFYDPANVVLIALSLVAILALFFVNFKVIKFKVLTTCLLMGTVLAMILTTLTQAYREAILFSIG
jgi:hypothetical protein